MPNKQSPTQRVTDQMASELTAQTPRLVAKLESDFQGSDRDTTSTAVWHSVIRQNWQDPMWRQAQATRVGPVPFVQDALKAFGLDPNGLKTIPPPPHINAAPAASEPNPQVPVMAQSAPTLPNTDPTPPPPEPPPV